MFDWSRNRATRAARAEGIRALVHFYPGNFYMRQNPGGGLHVFSRGSTESLRVLRGHIASRYGVCPVIETVDSGATYLSIHPSIACPDWGQNGGVDWKALGEQ